MGGARTQRWPVWHTAVRFLVSVSVLVSVLVSLLVLALVVVSV